MTTAASQSASATRSLWPHAPGYLDTALRGLPSRDSLAAARGVLDAWGNGSLEWKPWLDQIDEVRELFARLLGVNSRRISIGHSAASLMAAAARALPSRSRVVTLEGEHNSCTIPFLHAGNDLIVESVPRDMLMARLARGGFSAIAISAVQSSDGFLTDLGEIRRFADQAGALLCVDATQALGWLPFDVTLADLCVASCYKWLMGPSGAAVAYSKEQSLSRLVPASPNWFSTTTPHAPPYGVDFDPAGDGRRLDVVPALITLATLAPALKHLLSIGVAQVHAHNLALAAMLRQALALPEAPSAIVRIERPGAAAQLTRAGIQATARGTWVRFAFHLYNTSDDVQRVVDALGVAAAHR